jgi:hypothetical protein
MRWLRIAEIRASATRRILVFLGLTLALSALFFVPIAQAGSLQANGGLYVLGGMWCPGIAALLTKLVFDRSLRGLGWRPGNPRYLGLAYVLPIVYCAVAYGAVWLAGGGRLATEVMFRAYRRRIGRALRAAAGTLVPLSAGPVR